MSRRLLRVLVRLAAIGLISGCATQPYTGGVGVEDQEEPITGPSTVIAGAKVDEVRSIAMGAARSKGWTIVKASGHRVVQSRPVNPDAPQAVAAGLVGDGTQPSIEVTSDYRQVPNGVQVTVNAQLVSRIPDKDGKGSTEQRTDYTESFRDDLSRALDTLRVAWAENRQRVVRALPPINSAGQSAAETAAELSSGPIGATDGPAEAPLQSPLNPEPRPTAWGSSAEPTVADVAPAAQPSTSMFTGQPPPGGSFPAPVRSLPPGSEPSAAPGSTANNMLALNQGPRAHNEVGNAERYAELRGCQVQPGRTSVFRREADAEYLRVYCAGDPAFVIKCTNGVCKGLE